MEYVVFLAVILLILILPGRTKKYTGNQKYIDRLLKKHRCYQSKHFMTAREREFFRELCRALAGYPLLVMAQVRLVDVVQVCPGFSAKWHLNRSQFGIRIDHDLAFISDHS
ncbi:hypothetical protein ACQ9AN_23920, partial [Escherichia coli]